MVVPNHSAGGMIGTGIGFHRPVIIYYHNRCININIYIHKIYIYIYIKIYIHINIRICCENPASSHNSPIRDPSHITLLPSEALGWLREPAVGEGQRPEPFVWCAGHTHAIWS